MSYQGPIQIFYTDRILKHVRDEQDNAVYRAVIEADIRVDREELLKALQYDRDQYEKGFRDGQAYVPPDPTNKNLIRKMSDEDLAKLIFDLGNGSEYCYGHCIHQDNGPACNSAQNDYPRGCIAGVLAWLNSTADIKKE